ncbi:MAG: hypothetical protein EP299_13565 [Acidobacteria bacterium]|nr:MAG: hypothetical protein EP299_13565 [Acidobacteriota bacterium]
MRTARLVLVGLGLCLAPSCLYAQIGPVTLQFSFSNPGARSLGFGGAFVGLADDATAAFANPAGLVQLSRLEVSIEGRYWQYSTPFTLGGRLSGEPTGIGIDTHQGLRFGTSSDDLAGVSYLSFVYPIGKWSVAIYRHLSAKFEFTTRTLGFFQVPDPPLAGIERRQDLLTQNELESTNYGLAAAYAVTEDFSLGLGLVYTQADFRSLNEEYFPASGLFAPSTFAPETLIDYVQVTIDDSDLTFNLGLLWHLSSRWTLGGFYRQGPEFPMQGQLRLGPASHSTGEDVDLDFASPLGFPNVYGLGVAYRSAGGSTTVSFEWDRVEYSRIIDSIESDVIDTDDIALDDGDELHLGFEYAFLSSSPIVALRAGAWLDPDHRIRTSGTEDDPLGRALFQEGEDEIHLALGIGLAFKNFQVDFGLDFSDLVDTVSLSAIYSF